MRLSVMLALAIVCLVPQAAAATDLSGDWEIRAMGADTAVTIQQKKNKVMVHRVMWPEFEGERYKLEHLYRGKLHGSQINGQLLVKEGDQKEYEVLRKFTGRVINDVKIEVDTYVVVRTGGAPGPSAAPAAQPAPSHAAPAPAPRPHPKRAQPAAPVAPAEQSVRAAPAPHRAPAPAPPPPPPGGTRRAARPQPPEQPPRPPPSGGGEYAAAPGSGLFDSIMATPGMRDLFNVKTKEIAPAAQRLTDQGDALYQDGRYSEALGRFDGAAEVEGHSGPDLLHRMGRCYLQLRRYGQARKVLARALRLDPHNGPVRDDYARAAKHR